MHYRRARTPGGTYFFTVNLADRHSDILTRHVDGLHAVIDSVKERHPFSVVAMAVMPELLRMIGDRPRFIANPSKTQ